MKGGVPKEMKWGMLFPPQCQQWVHHSEEGEAEVVAGALEAEWLKKTWT